MSLLLNVRKELLWIYRERSGSPDFWAEPLNALSNASFLIAALCGLEFASRMRNQVSTTTVLLSLAGAVGLGSFLFHTIPNRFTMLLDVAPIALLQGSFLWLLLRTMLLIRPLAAALIVLVVAATSLALYPLHDLLNGSLFYLPPLLANFAIAAVWYQRAARERLLLPCSACCFALALGVRSVDWLVPWSFGTHFLWHLLTGAVVYLTLRAWIVFSDSVWVQSAQ